ncbi:sulfotransferase [Streptosporangium lutulentum]
MAGVVTPVLVTGLPRSGTSWTGKMLAASGELVYVNEPLNPQHPPGRSPGVLNAAVTHRFQYICPDNEESWLPAFASTVALRYGFLAELRRNRSPYDLARMVKYGTSFTLGRLGGRRALLDDPFALFSAGWFAERLGCRVIILLRDPVSFASSWQRLGWTVHFQELLEQPLLVRDQPHLSALRPWWARRTASPRPWPSGGRPEPPPPTWRPGVPGSCWPTTSTWPPTRGRASAVCTNGRA